MSGGRRGDGPSDVASGRVSTGPVTTRFGNLFGDSESETARTTRRKSPNPDGPGVGGSGEGFLDTSGGHGRGVPV